MIKRFVYVCLILLFFICFSTSAKASDIMNENFDSYNIGTIHDQGEWGSTSGVLVNNEQYVSSDQSLKLPVGSYGANWVAPGITNTEEFLYFSFYIDQSSGSANTVEATLKPTVHEIGGSNVINSMMHICTTTGTTFNLITNGAVSCSGGTTIKTGLVLDTWYDVTIEVNFITGSARAKVGTDDFSVWYNYLADQGIDYNVSLNVNNLNSASSKIYFDDIIWGAGSEDSGYISITDPTNDETVLGTYFGIEFNYWNYGSTTAPYDRVFIYISEETGGTLYYNWFNIDDDNVEEEKTRIIPTIPEAYLSILGSYDNVKLSVVLYNSITNVTSASVSRTFNIETPGSRSYLYNYPLSFYSKMDYIDGRPSKTFNNTNEQEIIVIAKIGDISCDDIAIGYFDFNAYTDNTFSTISTSETIKYFTKGGTYYDCELNEIFLTLDVDPVNPGPVYYQIDFYDSTVQDNKLNFLRFVIYYDVTDGVDGGATDYTNINEAVYCDDMTFYLPNYIGDPFKIEILNKICKAIFAPPSYFPYQMNRIKDIFELKFSFLYQIKNKVLASSSAIASGSTSPPSSQSGSYNGMSFNIADMFGGVSTSIVWIRSIFSVIFWLAFIIWLLRDIKKLFAKDKEIVTAN